MFLSILYCLLFFFVSPYIRLHLSFLNSPKWTCRSVYNTPMSTLTIGIIFMGPSLDYWEETAHPRLSHVRAGHAFRNSMLVLTPHGLIVENTQSLHLQLISFLPLLSQLYPLETHTQFLICYFT